MVLSHTSSLRQPTAREKGALQARFDRLGSPGYAQRINDLHQSLLSYATTAGKLPVQGLGIRDDFVYRRTPATGGSDRKAPARSERPPATAISSGRGSALRFELTLLALVQLRRKAGSKAHLAELELRITGDSRTPGWSDLVAAQPADTLGREEYHSSRDKRARIVHSALRTLKANGLIDVPTAPGGRPRWDDFVLLDEAGTKVLKEKQEYVVPGNGDKGFLLPAGFVLNDWLHVLEDSEITLLMMVVCAQGSFFEDGYCAFPGEERVLRYGIHRDRYSSARKTLEAFGLLDVREIGRYASGRAEDDERMLHRLRLNYDGFTHAALPTMLEKLEELLG